MRFGALAMPVLHRVSWWQTLTRLMLTSRKLHDVSNMLLMRWGGACLPFLFSCNSQFYHVWLAWVPYCFNLYNSNILSSWDQVEAGANLRLLYQPRKLHVVSTCSCDVPFSLLLELTIYPGFAPVPYWETACWCKFQLSSLEVWGFCTSLEESYSCSQQSLTYCVGCAGAQQWAVSEGTGDDRKGTSVPSHLSDWNSETDCIQKAVFCNSSPVAAFGCAQFWWSKIGMQKKKLERSINEQSWVLGHRLPHCIKSYRNS